MTKQNPAAKRRKIERLEAEIVALKAQLERSHSVTRKMIHDTVDADIRIQQARLASAPTPTATGVSPMRSMSPDTSTR